MSVKATIKVELLGQQFVLGGEEDVEHLQRVADFVRQKLGEIGAGTKSTGPTKIALLTALNIASEYYKTLDESAELKRQIALRSRNILQILDEATQ